MLPSYLQLLRLSGNSDRVHHGDEDGDVAQGAAHAAGYANAQGIVRPFGELDCSDVLTLWS